MKQSLLKVAKVELLPSKIEGVKFKKITFVGISIINNREAQTNVQGTRNLWPDHEVLLSDGTKTTIKGDPTFDIVEPGMLFEGSIHRFDTTPYEIDGRMVYTWKGVIFDSENALVVAARNLRQNSAAPKDPESGEPFQLAVSTRKTVTGATANETSAPVVVTEP